ncbi:putative Tia invasion determinant-related protein [Candidatus Desulfarcum epimagneticum]|uniref:Putative Tia invasion determinant-related protein n=1 Tax=uncultured Desulfobacteraceae bacterium TaxID=218296 RepID=A0A484HDX8_9BACT|nr:putative Tia invasion determinant-related protein [uncultured Desulfobacteraceae bacterium]
MCRPGGGVAKLNNMDGENRAGTDTVIETEDGWALSLALGEKKGAWRVEIEFGRQESDLTQISLSGFDDQSDPPRPFSELHPVIGDVSIDRLLANVYRDFNLTSQLTPYVMAGAGFAKIEFSKVRYARTRPGNLEAQFFYEEKQSDLPFAFQLGLGLVGRVSENFFAEVGYRFFYPVTPDFEYLADINIRGHQVLFGLRYHF